VIEDYVILEELLQPTMDEIDAIAMGGPAGGRRGCRPGFADLDNLTNGLHPRADDHRGGPAPASGSRRWRWDIARHAAVKHRKTAVIFSLEMSKTEITMRLLSAEAGIRLSQMPVRVDERTGLAEDRPADDGRSPTPLCSSTTRRT
jgi:replicative DNA helicase